MKRRDILKSISVGILGLFLFGCLGDGTPVAQEGSKSDYEVERLFKVDGCTVYRFEDGGHERYFADCKPGIIQPTPKILCSKSGCIKVEE